jgi:uridine kinase
LKVATVEYEVLFAKLQSALGPNRKPLLVGIDGKAGVGKTSLSNWLAWQFGMPAISLDLFVIQNTVAGPITRRIADLDRCIRARGDRPLIVEGILLLEALDEVGRVPDFLIFVEEQPPARGRLPDDKAGTREFSLANQVDRYFLRRLPSDRADFSLKGYAAG